MKNIIFLSLAIILMIATRGHASSLATIHLPDFTLPALLLAGVYFRQTWIALTIIISAVAIDNYAIIEQGVSANCITPAYSILPFTYYAVFWAGKFITSLQIDKNTGLNVAKIITIISAQWFVATISYYVWTKTFAENGFVGFGNYLAQWALVEIPANLYWIVAIIIIASIIPQFNRKKALG